MPGTERPNLDLISPAKVFCLKLLGRCIKLEAVFWFGKAVTLNLEKHIFVINALSHHGLDHLFRFFLLHTMIICPLCELSWSQSSSYQLSFLFFYFLF